VQLLAGITPARLASYDRPIRSAPQQFKAEVVPQLTDDLIAYRWARSLVAVLSTPWVVNQVMPHIK
jgi:hypothetical protein